MYELSAPICPETCELSSSKQEVQLHTLLRRLTTFSKFPYTLQKKVRKHPAPLSMAVPGVTR
eukprot:scaffold12263_cov18-Tisochrysis_lutea.AAC.3